MPALQEPTVQGIDSAAMLAALTALKKGDFSVRLPLDWTGVAGKVADTFNEVIELQRADGQGAGAAEPGRRQGGQDQPARLAGRRERLVGGVDRLGQRPDRRPRPPDERDGPRHRRRRPGRPLADDGPGDRRPPAPGRVPPDGQDHQQDGRPARLVRRRGDARGPRGRHRGQARRTGPGEGRRRHLEGPDRLASTRWPATSPARSATSPR